MTETWKDVMPAIPLARSVPVVFWALEEDERPQGPWQGDRGVATHVESERVMVSENGAHDAGSIEVGDAAGWRVDLDDPQGQRYAVNAWLDARPNWAEPSPMIAETNIGRLLRGKGTAADKLWLAVSASLLWEVAP